MGIWWLIFITFAVKETQIQKCNSLFCVFLVALWCSRLRFSGLLCDLLSELRGHRARCQCLNPCTILCFLVSGARIMMDLEGSAAPFLCNSSLMPRDSTNEGHHCFKQTWHLTGYLVSESPIKVPRWSWQAGLNFTSISLPSPPWFNE